MRGLVNEFIKLSLSTKALLELDPDLLDPLNPAHKELLAQKAQALEQVKQYKPSPEDLKYKKQLFRQMIFKGLGTAGKVGIGAGLGYGLGSVISPKGQAKTLLGKHPFLLSAGLTGTAALALYGSYKGTKVRERELQRAHTILKPKR